MITDSVTATCETLAPIIVGPDGSVEEQAVSPQVAKFLQGWKPSSRPTDKDVAESERVGQKIRAVPKQCWFNARRVIQNLKDYTQASYIEGWAVSQRGFLIEHGWIIRDGMIIDPTLPTKAYRYFPGLEFRGRAGIREFLSTTEGRKCHRSPFFHAFGWGGGDSPSYAKALQDSLAYSATFGCRDE